VPIWVEKFALPVLGTAIVGLVIFNVLKMDWIQKTGIALGIFGFSLYLSQTLHLFNKAKTDANPSQLGEPKKPEVQQSSQGANSPNVAGDRNIVGNTIIIQPETRKKPEAPTTPSDAKPVEQPFAFQEQTPDVFTVELYRGSRAEISRSDLTEKGWGPFKSDNERPFGIFLENGHLYAEAKIYNGPGLPAVEVKKNDFLLRPMNWDRNFTDAALEIVNEKSQPVLQVIYKRKGLIQIQGIFRSPEGGGIYEAPEPPEALPRIFKYPSWKYKGQYAEDSDQDVSPFARASNAEFVAFIREWLRRAKGSLVIGKTQPSLLHRDFMTWFYEKGGLYRAELLRRLEKKGSPEIDGLYKSLNPQSSNAVKPENSYVAITKILEDIEVLNNELSVSNH
jgi:hypothetical protein